MKHTLMVSLVVLSSVAALAAPAKKAPAKAKTQTAQAESEEQTSFAPKKARLGTDFSFAGSHVDGKYLQAGDSVAEVEDEKEMGALIGIRKNFHDKLAAERARLKAEGK